MRSVLAGSGEPAGDTFFASFPDGWWPDPNDNDAYVHVRVSKQVRPTGSVTVYLPNGTALLVPSQALVRLAPVERQPAELTALARNAGNPT